MSILSNITAGAASIRVPVDQKIADSIRGLVTEELFQDVVDIIINGKLEHSPAEAIDARIRDSRALKRIRVVIGECAMKAYVDRDRFIGYICTMWRLNAAKMPREDFLDIIVGEISMVI